MLVSNRYSFEQQLNLQEQINTSLDSINRLQKKQLSAMRSISDNNYSMYNWEVTLNAVLKSDLNKSQKQIRKYNRHRKGLVTVLAGAVVYGVYHSLSEH